MLRIEIAEAQLRNSLVLLQKPCGIDILWIIILYSIRISRSGGLRRANGAVCVLQTANGTEEDQSCQFAGVGIFL